MRCNYDCIACMTTWCMPNVWNCPATYCWKCCATAMATEGAASQKKVSISCSLYMCCVKNQLNNLCCTVESNNNNSILYFCCSNRQLHRLIARLQMILLIILSCPKIKTIHVLQLLIKKQLPHHPVHRYHNSKTTLRIQKESTPTCMKRTKSMTDHLMQVNPWLPGNMVPHTHHLDGNAS